MPGLFGIISKSPASRNTDKLNIMLNSMHHESFYSTGIYNNNQLGLSIGWVCHPNSFCDCMPIWNEKKDILLIFFGENFAETDSLNYIKDKNHVFNMHNASYLVHMYEEYGLDFLQKLNGWFSGVLVDIKNNKAVLFNDRYGMQKIFYYEEKEAFFFASEAKAILKLVPTTHELDMKGATELLSCNCVLENRTLFRKVFLLPASSFWIFADTKLNKNKYFDPEVWEKQSLLGKDEFYEQFRTTLIKILPKYFQANQKIAISLTGGLDTRMILANIDLPAAQYPCYTFGSMYRDCYDVKVAQKVARASNQSHQIITLDDKFLSNFPKYAEKALYITDGYLDVTGSPEVYVNNIARSIAPIRLTGNFGGEVTRTIRWLHARKPNANLFSQDFNKLTNAPFGILNKINQGIKHPLTFTLFYETPWHNNNRFVCEQSQLTLRSPYLDTELTALMYRAPTEITGSERVAHRLIADGNPKLEAILTDRGIGGYNYIISKFVHLYREFFFKAEYAYNYGMPQWLAQMDSMVKFMHLERLFLGRHKFYHFRLWYRDQLADYVKAVLLDKKTLERPYLNPKAVEDVVLSHTKGYRNYTTEISQLLTIELIQRLLIEAS